MTALIHLRTLKTKTKTIFDQRRFHSKIFSYFLNNLLFQLDDIFRAYFWNAFHHSIWMNHPSRVEYQSQISENIEV